MSKPRKPHHFYCEIYMVNIYFYQGISGEETSASLKKYLNLNFDSKRFDGAGGKALEFESGDYVVWTKKTGKKALSTLTHECLHVANMILKAKGISVDLENDEAQAYLLGWLVKKCLEFKK